MSIFKRKSKRDLKSERVEQFRLAREASIREHWQTLNRLHEGITDLSHEAIRAKRDRQRARKAKQSAPRPPNLTLDF